MGRGFGRNITSIKITDVDLCLVAT